MEKGYHGNIPILLLAAGSSSRMGQSKQLLAIDGVTLIQKMAEICFSANTGKVIVVLGAREDEHRKVIQHLPVAIVSNPDWNKGMGTSIKAGIKYITSQLPMSTGVIISVCDQPYLTSKHLSLLAKGILADKQLIIASNYQSVRGVPALFDAFYFDDLLQLENADGAKTIIQKYSHVVKELPFPQGIIDLDTIEDYNTFIDNPSSS